MPTTTDDTTRAADLHAVRGVPRTGTVAHELEVLDRILGVLHVNITDLGAALDDVCGALVAEPDPFTVDEHGASCAIAARVRDLRQRAEAASVRVAQLHRSLEVQ